MVNFLEMKLFKNIPTYDSIKCCRLIVYFIDYVIPCMICHKKEFNMTIQEIQTRKEDQTFDC